MGPNQRVPRACIARKNRKCPGVVKQEPQRWCWSHQHQQRQGEGGQRPTDRISTAGQHQAPITQLGFHHWMVGYERITYYFASEFTTFQISQGHVSLGQRGFDKWAAY